MRRVLWTAACICFALILATCAPAYGAKVITPQQNIDLAQTVANAALQSKGCQALYAENFPTAEKSAVQMYTEEIWIIHFQFDNEIVGADYIAVVMPVVNPRRIMVNTTFAGIMVPSELGETLIHEFFHLMDYAYGDNEAALVTEEMSQVRAKACMDSLYKVYPEARPHDWKDGPRPLK